MACYDRCRHNIGSQQSNKDEVYREETEQTIPANLADLTIIRYIPSDRLKVLIDLYLILDNNKKSTRKRGRPKDTAVVFLLYELYHLLLLAKYGNYTSTLKMGGEELIQQRWTFSKEIAEVLLFLGHSLNDEQYYHAILKRVCDIIPVPPGGVKQPHRIYAPVVHILVQPACIEALSRYCKTILEPLAEYVPRLYEYLSNPAHYKHSKKDPTKKESMQRLKSLFCTDFFSE
jgi:hypothetical protein